MRKGRKRVRRSVQTQGSSFTCVFERNEQGTYTVTCPALPGVVTEGRTLEEATQMAKEAVALHCECLLEDREEIPRDPDIFLAVVHVPLRKDV